MSSITIDPARMIFIPAEVEDADALIALRNERMTARRASSPPRAESKEVAPDDVESVHVPGQGDWRRADLEMIRDWISDNGRRPAPGASYRGLHTLFELTADAAGDWVTKAEAEDAAGVDARQLQNEMAALTKISRKIKGEKSWPIEWRQVGRTYSYRMDPRIAQWWLDGRKGDLS